MKKVIKSIFRSLGIEIKKVGGQQVILPTHEVFSGTMQCGLKRMKEKKLEPKTIIDLGAARGTWSVSAMKFWPHAHYLLFEPLSERRNELEQLKSIHKNIHVVYAAAGKEKGKIDFSVTNDLDGSGVYQNHPSAKQRTIEIGTIDEEIERTRLKPPFLIKFDTHGFEIPILEGAKKTLKETQLIVMECYGFHISKNCLILHDMCAHLEKLGFRMADMVDLMRRPGDELFWQCDLFFLPSSDKLFERITYAP